MKFFKSIVINSVFALTTFLLFILVFRDSVDIPPWLQVFGRMHPMVLHLPIGFLILVVLLVLFRSGFKRKSFQNLLNFVLYLSALAAVVTALMGIILSEEGGYEQGPLNLHLASGIAVSILSTVLLLLSLFLEDEKKVFNFVLGLTFIILILAGHFGSVLTHGDDFLWQPIKPEPEIAVTDSTSLFQAAIRPVLKGKCYGCHNERKAKGELVMTSIEKLMKGGKDGAIWVAGHPEKSLLIKRIQLPEGHDDHMPPDGKPQLSSQEKKLLSGWIASGADPDKAWTKYPHDSLLLLAVEAMKHQIKPAVRHYTFSFAGEDVIEGLNTAFCTVKQIAPDEPAVQVDFFLSQAFDRKKLEELLKINEQVISINLTRMPVNDADGKTLGQFTNLEKLNLNQTAVSGKILESLTGLTHLESISLAGTQVDRKSLDVLSAIGSLKEVFLWNTKVSVNDTASLRNQYPKVHWDLGYQAEEVLKLTPPLLVNPSNIIGNEGIQLKNNLPGARIHYTLDGTEPDSLLSPQYQGPVALAGYRLLKTRAFKQGWYGSPLAQFYLFRQGIKPDEAELLSQPDKDYKGEGIATLVDGKKGTPDEFRNIAWLAFRAKPLEAIFKVAGDKVKTVTLSYCENVYSYIFAPASLELWSGTDPAHLKLIQQMTPRQPGENSKTFVKGLQMPVPAGSGPYYKIVARPLPKVPVWVSKKPEKGWLFVDEVVFNE